MTNEMHNYVIINFYSTVFCLLYMFRTNLVLHYQEHGIIYCITQFGTIGTIVLSGESSCYEVVGVFLPHVSVVTSP